MVLRNACCGRKKLAEGDSKKLEDFKDTEILFLMIRLLGSIVSLCDLAAKAAYLSKAKFSSQSLLDTYE